MALDFLPDEPTCDPGRDVVRFAGWDGGFPVRCGVTREALMVAGRIRQATPEDLLGFYETLKSRIHPIADAKDRQRRFEEDGLILVRTADLKF